MPRHILRRIDGPGLHTALCMYIYISLLMIVGKQKQGLGRRLNSVECLPHRHQDLCLIPRAAGLTVHVYIPQVEEAEKEGS